MSNELKDFNSIFSMNKNYLENYTQFMIRNRVIFDNWLKVFGIPAVICKLRKEKRDPSQFSKVDKYVKAYGKALTSFNNDPRLYDYYQIYLPIQNDSFNKISQQFQQIIQINTPFKDEFLYIQGDIVLFRYNQWVFSYEIKDEPDTYADVLVQFNMTFISKYAINDRILVKDQQSAEPNTDNEEYW